eukprot:COSAG05_NODE_1498_length_4705_cov_11.449197_7_plen_127_part_00
MHIETSADARESRRRATGGGPDGPAVGGRGYLAAAASQFSLWWSGKRHPSALTADATSGAGLHGGPTDSDPPSNGDASLAPSAGAEPPSQSNQRGWNVRGLAARGTWAACTRVLVHPSLALRARSS